MKLKSLSRYLRGRPRATFHSPWARADNAEDDKERISWYFCVDAVVFSAVSSSLPMMRAKMTNAQPLHTHLPSTHSSKSEPKLLQFAFRTPNFDSVRVNLMLVFQKFFFLAQWTLHGLFSHSPFAPSEFWTMFGLSDFILLDLFPSFGLSDWFFPFCHFVFFGTCVQRRRPSWPQNSTASSNM